MNRKKITKIVTLFCIVPLTVVSAPLLVIGMFLWPIITFSMGFSGVYEVLSHPLGGWSMGELVPTVVPLGVWGLYSLWALSTHYMKEDCFPKKTATTMLGLIAGFITGVQLIVNNFSSHRGGEGLSYLLIFSLGSMVAYFIFLLITYKKSNKETPKSNISS